MSEETVEQAEIKSEETGQERVTYSYTHALEAAKDYFNGEELPAKVFVDKYAMKDLNGRLYENSPNQMHWRLAKEFGRIERTFMTNKLNGNDASKLSAYGKSRELLSTQRIYDLFKDFKYIVPQGSVMAILGNEFVIGSLSNCIVLPELHDSYGGILYADQELVQLMKRRCGVGLDLSTLRPSGSSVTNAAGSSTGPVSFMERFSNTTREVAQSGRRGALMLTIDISHPDVENFVTIKQDLSKVTGANISVRLSDEFMQAVKDDKEYTHRWPLDEHLKPGETQVKKVVNAKDLWNTIIKAAHTSAEPGLIFWDRQHKYSTSSVYPGFRNTSTNPCSEIAMQGGDSCRLIAMNLFGCVINPFTPEAYFDHEKFYEVTYESQRLMDDLVELEIEAVSKIIQKIEEDPEPEKIKQVELDTWKLLLEAGKKGRRTGLGFTALGDAIAALGFKFDSDESIATIDKIMRTKLSAEFDSSIDMAIERGTFHGFDRNIELTSEFIQMMKTDFNEIYGRMLEYGRRNISISTVAPTGSLSILTQTSSGLEPVFMLSYKRRKKITHSGETNVKVDFVDEMGDKWQEFIVHHPKLKMWMEITGQTDESKSPYAGSTAPEIEWSKRVEMQAVIQKYITHSISSTINLPNDVSVEKVGEIYMKSWEMGLKGITVYRDGSRSGVLVSNDKPAASSTTIYENNAPKRPKTLDCDVIRFTNKGEKWIGFVGLFEGRPYEVFTGKADAMKIPYYVESGKIRKTKTEKDGSKYDFVFVDKDKSEVVEEWLNKSFDKHYWNYAKMLSGILRHGMPLPYVVDLINSLNLDDDLITTWKNGISRMIKKYIPDGTAATDKQCKQCKSESVIYQEGCLVCNNCGSSKCG
jgi:ribonucleoside-diphosphate reductase alpha chain